ncbi:MAG: ATP-binding cassette domain-containing protein [Actinomycetaceae bacterium]|nr:ATP-binding cassette domain-containing protein [Actinomycetaceae bacterium]MDY6082702.1 ATP-binding cassette domain-containing protein [Actinomycetaceae bacterium]
MNDSTYTGDETRISFPPLRTQPSIPRNTKPSSQDARDVTVVVHHVSRDFMATSSSPEDRKRAKWHARVIGKLLGHAPKVKVHALKNVNLVAHSGDFVGILGENGAGKSTLIQVMSGAIQPTSGEVYAADTPTVMGVSGALLPHLPGIENARLGLLALGFSPAQAEAALPDILDFTDIGNAIYRPMNTYSAGMRARLTFAISTAIQPKILLIDEGLSTGDSTFQEKSRERSQRMLDDAGTIFLVSHSAGMIRTMCNRAIWLHKGEIIADGDTESLSTYYERWADAVAKHKTDTAQRIIEDLKLGYNQPHINVTAH